MDNHDNRPSRRHLMMITSPMEYKPNLKKWFLEMGNKTRMLWPKVP